MRVERFRLPTRSLATGHGHAGASTHETFERQRTLYRARQKDAWRARERGMAGVAAALLVLPVAAEVALGGWAALPVLVAAVAAMAVLTWQLVRLPPELARLRSQARAERVTAGRLDRLADVGYLVLHDRTLPSNPGVRLNHLVIGPTGIFFVETRRVAGPVRVGGGVLWDGQLPLQGAMQRVRWMAEQVVSTLQGEAPQWNVLVIPRSALHGAEVPENVQSCEGVGVVALDNLVRNITTMAPALGPMEVAYLGECAERAFSPAVG